MKPRKRRVWGIALLALTAIGIVVTWRATSLDGLPDVGDPFDVAAYADPEVAADRNAFTFYRHAKALMTDRPSNPTYDWSTAGPAEKAWLEANREALEIWRRGTNRPEALYNPPRSVKFDTLLPVIQELRVFAGAAGLEGTRLEASGDMDGALTWYLAILRSSRHCGTRGVIIERLVGIAIHKIACGYLTKWAADPRVNATMLRRAIDGVLAAEKMTRPTSEAFKTEYLMMIHSIEDPKMMTPEVFAFATGQDRSSKSDTRLQKAMREDIPRIFKREPERSRRVIRLIYANLLADCDLPIAQQSPTAATIPPGFVPPTIANAPTPPSRPGTVTTLILNLHAVDPSSPAAARALPPAEIARWWDSTLYAKACMMSTVNFPQAILREQTIQAALLATLRAEFEKREHPQPTGANPGADRP